MAVTGAAAPPLVTVSTLTDTAGARDAVSGVGAGALVQATMNGSIAAGMSMVGRNEKWFVIMAVGAEG